MIPPNLKCQTTLPTEFSGKVYVIKANEQEPKELSEHDKIMLQNKEALCKTGIPLKLDNGTLLCEQIVNKK
tara:strand:- start:570 stop:782 length:213 start_codon:yes stop_codon:yes gene_type:complete